MANKSAKYWVNVKLLQFPTCWPIKGLFVHWSRGWGVLSFSERLVDNVPIIVSSWNFQEFLPLTKLMSMQKVKVRGQRSSHRGKIVKFDPDSNSNSKYVYCQYIEIQHVYNCQHCVSYTLQPNRYEMEWNGNGACRLAANPGTTAPGLPLWCRDRGPETTWPNRGSGTRRWNFGQPNPRWAAVARPKVGAPG